MRTRSLYYDAPITYRGTRQQVDALAGELQHLGVEKGDRVMLFMQERAPVHHRLLRRFCAPSPFVVPINPMNRSAELEHYLQDTQASVCICSQEVFPHIEPLIGHERLRHVIVAAYSDYIHPQTDLDLPAEVAALGASRSAPPAPYLPGATPWAPVTSPVNCWWARTISGRVPPTAPAPPARPRAACTPIAR